MHHDLCISQQIIFTNHPTFNKHTIQSSSILKTSMNGFIKFYKTRIADKGRRGWRLQYVTVGQRKQNLQPGQLQHKIYGADQPLQMNDPTTKISNSHLIIILMKHNNVSMQYNHPAQKKNDLHHQKGKNTNVISQKFQKHLSCIILASIKEAKYFATNILSPCFFVIHDASRCCQHNITKLQSLNRFVRTQLYHFSCREFVWQNAYDHKRQKTNKKTSNT